jgi:AraC-like DNA-binding protein
MTTSPRALVQRNILILMEWYDHRIRQGIGHYAREHNWHLTVDELAVIPRGWEGDGVLTVFFRRRDLLTYIRRLAIPVVDMGLYRLFLLHLHRSVHEEVQRARLAAVKRLLAHSDLKLADIARKTGFCHAQHLNNVFRNAESLTPRAYRKRYTMPSIHGTTVPL